jgi:hypothetical protein
LYCVWGIKVRRQEAMKEMREMREMREKLSYFELKR